MQGFHCYLNPKFVDSKSDRQSSSKHFCLNSRLYIAILLAKFLAHNIFNSCIRCWSSINSRLLHVKYTIFMVKIGSISCTLIDKNVSKKCPKYCVHSFYQKLFHLKHLDVNVYKSVLLQGLRYFTHLYHYTTIP